jgi:3-deoxy-D-manno-octulosonic-acid transferase
VDEDDAVVEAFRQVSAQYPRVLLILAPRRPERFDEVERKLGAAGLAFARRSREGAGQGIELPCVLLLDTIGELASLFPLADVVFLGGTLAHRGGHNILEPAACGKPVIVGPHLENFAAMAAEFRAGAGLFEIASPGELGAAVVGLLADQRLRKELGSRASALAVSQRGATLRAAKAILDAHGLALPVWRRAGFTRPLLWELSQLWTWGGRVKQRRTLAFHLDAPVISVGGIGMGGAGKTPFTDLLAGRLQGRGHVPAILTRGYRRRSVEEVIVVPAGASVPAIVTGDEPQIFVRSGKAHVGIGSDRWTAGRAVEERLGPDVFLLDDGFQHFRLDRDLNIVLIDALDPFAGDAVFPLGGLREPLEALSRADAFVITRAEHGRSYRGIVERLRLYQPDAPVFHASVLPRYWVNHTTGEQSESAPQPALAFCGLGNPASFWQTLRALGIHPRFRWSFGDHHRYRTVELRRLRRHAENSGAQALLTTEKDAMNLPANALDLVKPCEIWWLKIESELWEEEAFLQMIEGRLS